MFIQALKRKLISVSFLASNQKPIFITRKEGLNELKRIIGELGNRLQKLKEKHDE
jgi:hypothetical protein